MSSGASLSGARRVFGAVPGCGAHEGDSVAAGGRSNTESPSGSVNRQAVSTWRKRFCQEGLQGLEERPRPGRPRRFPRHRWARSRRWRASCPGGVPLSRWSSAELAREASSAGSSSDRGVTIWRWLAEDAIKPVAAPLLDLPARPPSPRRQAGSSISTRAAGRGSCSRRLRRLRRREAVDSAARAASRQPATPGGDGQLVEHEYERKGALCYLAAWDVRRASCSTAARRRTGSSRSRRLVEHS